MRSWVENSPEPAWRLASFIGSVRQLREVLQRWDMGIGTQSHPALR